MPQMRAKMRVTQVDHSETGGPNGGPSDRLYFTGVSRPCAYPADGTDEDNSFALWTPSVDLNMVVNNPALVGVFKYGDTFYVDFIPIESAASRAYQCAIRLEELMSEVQL